MRLRDRFERPEEELSPEAQQELAAVDAALAGVRVDEEMAELEALAELVRDERELPSERFAQRLDEWAAAGFPATDAPARQRSRWDALGRRLSSTPPRRVLAPAGAALTLIVIVAVVIGEAGNLGGGDDAGVAVQRTPGVTPESGEAAAPDAAGSATSAPEKATPSAQASRLRSGAVAQRSTSGHTGALDLIRQGRAKIARTVSLALATSSADFHDAADGVFDVVDAHNGFVRDSNVASGDPGLKGAEPGQAQFDLRIPAAQLEAATAELSDLGHVVSRTDGTRDITSSYVSTKRRIAAFEETRDSLLKQLEDAFTEAEQQSIKRRLRIVEAQLAAAQDQLGDIQRRVHFVPVAVTITADDSLGAGGGGSDWSVGDALDDAGRVLEVAAGVLVVSAAVLVPVGLVAIIGLLSAREIRRRQREAALD